jgi:CRISPR-associated protein Cas1
MIKRTIEISREPAHLTIQHRQLVLKRDGAGAGSVPSEDVGMVVVDQPRTSYSHAALVALAQNDAALIVCGADHLPLAMLVPMADHTQVTERLRLQIRAKRPLQKRLWRQLVREKILAQSALLAKGCAARRKLMTLARSVRSGDPDNFEAQAARIYWGSWLADVPTRAADRPNEVPFARDRDGLGPNALLNYGYAIMRAAVARAVVAAGLHPAIGLHHSNRSNAFCLADDLLEPLRPIVDDCVRNLYFAGQEQLDQPTKAQLLQVLTTEVCQSRGNPNCGPLLVMLHRYVASLVRCLVGVDTALDVPVAAHAEGKVDQSASQEG